MLFFFKLGKTAAEEKTKKKNTMVMVWLEAILIMND